MVQIETRYDKIAILVSQQLSKSYKMKNSLHTTVSTGQLTHSPYGNIIYGSQLIALLGPKPSVSAADASLFKFHAETAANRSCLHPKGASGGGRGVGEVSEGRQARHAGPLRSRGPGTARQAPRHPRQRRSGGGGRQRRHRGG
eukprot:scaffold195727_cov31-Prasinocladus_malaysianus.AAC.1